MQRIRWFDALLLILGTLFAQLLMSIFLGFATVKPNLMVISVVFLGLFTDRKFAFEAGFLGGLLLDSFSIRLFGMNTLLFACCGYVIGRFNNRFYRNSMITHFILVFVFSLFVFSSSLFLINIRNSHFVLEKIEFNSLFNSRMFLAAVFNSILGMGIFAFLSRVFGISEDLI